LSGKHHLGPISRVGGHVEASTHRFDNGVNQGLAAMPVQTLQGMTVQFAYTSL